MKRLIGTALAATIAFGFSTPALARDGCGAGFHRGPAGHCRPNRGRAVVVARPAVGVFYAGRGYWDGRRYWKQRYRHHGAWRYR